MHDSGGHRRTALLEDLHDDAEHGLGLGDDLGKMIDEFCRAASLFDRDGLLRHWRHGNERDCLSRNECVVLWFELGCLKRGDRDGLKRREKEEFKS